MMDGTVAVRVVSFSYRAGVPEDPWRNGGGFVFDCRGLPNPFWESGLRGFRGKDEPVVAFFREREAEIAPFLDAAESLVLQTIRVFQTDGRTRLQAAFGCTGGQHRSVYMAERLAERLRRVPGVSVEVVHLAESHWRIGGSAGAQ